MLRTEKLCNSPAIEAIRCGFIVFSVWTMTMNSERSAWISASTAKLVLTGTWISAEAYIWVAILDFRLRRNLQSLSQSSVPAQPNQIQNRNPTSIYGLECQAERNPINSGA
jgi:hypothetical protein